MAKTVKQGKSDPPNPFGDLGAPAVPDKTAENETESRPLRDIEREAIERAIAGCGGNVPTAAALLGISPSTIYRKRLTWKD